MPTRDQPYSELWLEKLKERQSPNSSSTVVAEALGLVGAEASNLPQVTGVSIVQNVRSVIVTWAAVSNATVFYEVQLSTVGSMAGATSFIVGSNRFEYMEGVQETVYFVRVRAKVGTLIGPWSVIVSEEPGKTQTLDIEPEAVNTVSFTTELDVINVPGNTFAYTELMSVTFTGTGAVLNVTFSDFLGVIPDLILETDPYPNRQFSNCGMYLDVNNDTDAVNVLQIFNFPAIVGWFLSMTGWTTFKFVYTLISNPVIAASFATVAGKQYTIAVFCRSISVADGGLPVPTMPMTSNARNLLIQEIKR